MISCESPFGSLSWKAIVNPSGKVWQEVRSRQSEEPFDERVETYKRRLSDGQLLRFSELLNYELAEEASRVDRDAARARSAVQSIGGGLATYLSVGHCEGQAWTMFVVTDREDPLSGGSLDPDSQETLEDFEAMWLELTRFLPWQPGLPEALD